MRRTACAMIRPTCSLYLPRGRFSSMLDMGGIGLPDANTRINVGKNNKVRAVALDFHLITRSIEERRRSTADERGKVDNGNILSEPSSNKSSPYSVKPDTSLVEKMAKLLNVQLGENSSLGQKSSRTGENDDLSAILGSSKGKQIASEAGGGQPKKNPLPSSPSHIDIRSKYASKLRTKIDGGVHGIDLAKSEKDEALKRGDAQSHMAARALVSSHAIPGNTLSDSSSSSRWLAATGVGKLLSFLSGRSMHIVLLPLPSTPSQPQSENDVKKTADEMNNLTKQLPHVHFDLLISDGRRRGEIGTDKANEATAQYVLDNILAKFDLPPLRYVVVSDRDDYLRAARDSGMFTCRVRSKNMRRGEVTASYNVEDVGSVESVINEINGISFNSALKG